MDINNATFAFAALSQSTRVEVVRLLVRAGAEGMSAGEIGEVLGVKQNTMSANLNILLRSGLVRNERQGRTIRYYADFGGLRGMLSFLMEDCCGGEPELCEPLLDSLVCDC